MAEEKKDVLKKEEQSPEKQIQDLQGIKNKMGEKITSKRTGDYFVLPAAISELPELQKLFDEWQNLPKDISTLDDRSSKLMSKIIHFGLKENYPNLTVEQCGKLFSLSDFPKVFKIIMDINDFFTGMREITVLQRITTKEER